MEGRKFHEYLDMLIDMSGLKNVEISRQIGLKQANYLSMVRKGDSKIAIERVPKLAKALNIDPAHLVRAALEEYNPELLRIIDECFGNKPITDEEFEIIQIMREAVSGGVIKANTAAKKKSVQALAKELV